MSIIKKLSGLSTLYTNDINATGYIDTTQDISGYTIVGIPSNYFNGITSNIQQQFNDISNNLKK